MEELFIQTIEAQIFVVGILTGLIIPNVTDKEELKEKWLK